MNSSCALINVITKPTGGGAEFLVRGLHEYLLKQGERSYLIFLDDDKHILFENYEQSFLFLDLLQQ